MCFVYASLNLDYHIDMLPIVFNNVHFGYVTVINQVRVQPFLNGHPFKIDRAFISTRSALPASVFKHLGVY